MCPGQLAGLHSVQQQDGPVLRHSVIQPHLSSRKRREYRRPGSQLGCVASAKVTQLPGIRPGSSAQLVIVERQAATVSARMSIPAPISA
jgi:hypothetical protein